MIPVEMEVTEAPPAMMEVDSTILERVEKVRSEFSSGLFKPGLQVEKVASSDEAQYQPPSEIEPGQVCTSPQPCSPSPSPRWKQQSRS